MPIIIGNWAKAKSWSVAIKKLGAAQIMVIMLHLIIFCFKLYSFMALPYFYVKMKDSIFMVCLIFKEHQEHSLFVGDDIGVKLL